MKCLSIFALAFALLLASCARNSDSDNRQTVATVPQYGTQGYGAYCMQSGGYGCRYGSYPTGFSAYPTYSNGYYYGYNSGAYYYNTSYYSACPYGSVAAYSPYFGLGCVQTGGTYAAYTYYIYSAQPTYYYYNYGGYNALVYCTAGYNGCPSGTACVAYTTGAAYGFCRY